MYQLYEQTEKTYSHLTCSFLMISLAFCSFFWLCIVSFFFFVQFFFFNTLLLLITAYSYSALAVQLLFFSAFCNLVENALLHKPHGVSCHGVFCHFLIIPSSLLFVTSQGGKIKVIIIKISKDFLNVKIFIFRVLKWYFLKENNIQCPKVRSHQD